jgi:hypothetical protein
MGNTITVNIGNSGAVAPEASVGEDKGGGGINIGNTAAAEEEDEPSCFEKLGCMLCGGE